MKHPLHLLVAATVIVATQSVASEAPKVVDFALRMPLTLAQSDGLHVVELNEVVYRAGSSRSLADLRIFNANGEALAWAVLPSLAPEQKFGVPINLSLVPLPQQQDMRAMVLKSYAIRVERDERRAIVEVAPLQPVELPPGEVGGYLIDARPAKDLSGQLSLVFDASAPDYASRLEILGSEDLVNWRPLTSGPLALNRKLGDPVERSTYELKRPPPFLRLQWASAAPPQLAGARFAERGAVPMELPRTTLAVFADSDRRDSWLVDIPPALPLERLHFRPATLNESFGVSVYRRDPSLLRLRPHLFSRRHKDQWIPIGQVDVMRIMRGGAEVRGEPLVLSGSTDRLRLDPIGPSQGDVPVVEGEWRPARIAFVARAPGPYFLAIGNADAKQATPLDLRTALADNDRAGAALPIAVLTSGNADQRVAQAAAQQRVQRIASEAGWSRYVLWFVLLAATAAMGWMAWRLSLQLRREK